MIENLFCDQNLYASVSCCRYAEAETSDVVPNLTKEHVLTLFSEGQPLQRFLCSPAQLTELCVGWLCDEGYIRTVDEVKELRISADGATATVSFVPQKTEEMKAFPALAAVNDALCKRAADILLNGETVHRKTRGTHGCVYVSEDGAEIFCEDIGRNNAMDKAIGSMLLQGKAAGQGMLFSSGRVTAEIAKKVIRAGIPALVSKAAVTLDAVHTANRYRLRLAFFADDRRYVLPDESLVL